MPISQRERVDLTLVLKNILDNYPAGSAILRETLQNSDDAGARKQTFILDLRDNHSKDHLLDDVLADCQGPAIIGVNDSIFKEKDWIALTNVHQSSKAQDETTTGKYGLGFRSCYHVTDNPHILSDNQLLILDPHEAIQGEFSGGAKLSLLSEREKYASHFDTFSAVLGPSQFEYKETAIRLPLRLPNLALTSRIKNTPVTVEGMQGMFKDFIEKELQDVMLFLKNILSIELVEVEKDGTRKILARAWIDADDRLIAERSRVRGRQEELSRHELKIHVEVDGQATVVKRWKVVNSVLDYAEATSIMEKRVGRTIGDELAADKLLPHVALAYPLVDLNTKSEQIKGKLFTLLPLPIFSGFPLHIHGILALTSSRQNLRNSQDLSPGSREELLVEWNRAIFHDFAPRAWSSLLEALTDEPSIQDIYQAWPPSSNPSDPTGDRAYWSGLSARLLDRVGGKGVWRVSRQEVKSYSHLLDAQNKVVLLVAPQTTPEALLEALSHCNISITCPPPGVYQLVEKSTTYAGNVMSPLSVYEKLKANTRGSSLSALDSQSAKIVCDYLSSAGNVSYLLGLPFIPTVGPTPATLMASKTYVLATKDEASLFAKIDPKLIAMDALSKKTTDLLMSGQKPIARRLKSDDVVQYLNQRYAFNSSLSLVSNGVTAEHVDFLIRLWHWMATWHEAGSLLGSGRLGDMHLLPVRSTGANLQLRRFKNKTIDPRMVDPELQQALLALHIPIMHPSIGVERLGRLSSYLLVSTHDIIWILEELSRRNNFNLGLVERKTLHSHFSRHAPSYRQPFTANQLKTLRQLPIFPLLPVGEKERDESKLDYGCALPGSSVFVDSSVTIIPKVQGLAFIEIAAARALLGHKTKLTVSGELNVLETAVDHWAQQSKDVERHLVDRLIRRLNDLSTTVHSKVRTLPFVTVGPAPIPTRKPAEVVDSEASIAALYSNDDHVLPWGLFSDNKPGGYLHQLRTYSLIQTRLSSSIIAERITSFVDPATPINRKSTQALHLLRLLDASSPSRTSSSRLTHDFPPFPPQIQDPWIPIGEEFYKPSECQDSREKEALLCDYVKPFVPYVVSSEHLRGVLGWDKVENPIVLQQLLAVVRDEPRFLVKTSKSRVERISLILIELARRFSRSEFSEQDIEMLLEDMGDQEWVPTTADTVVVPQRATLQAVNIGTLFSQVRYSLRREDNVRKFLLQLGISDRPTRAMLSTELRTIENQLQRDDLMTVQRLDYVKTSVLVLEEMSKLPTDNCDVLVPDDLGTLRPIEVVVYNDLGPHPMGIPSHLYLAHPSVSLALAESLGLLKLSDEQFNARDDDDVDSFQMGEDLSTRISGVLREYDIEYSSNEWVANADDAGASQVSIIVDEATYPTDGLMNPKMAEYHKSPAVVIYNDGVFTEDDFKGLGNIGKGGKGGNPNAIGRFGLGAFSFYHFTDMPMVVSADSVLFLDPLQQNLPRLKGGAKRSGLKMSIKKCRLTYPNQLASLYGFRGFDADTSDYKGTLIRLPLRTLSQSHGNKLSERSWGAVAAATIVNRFYSSAVNSLFFSKVASITASRRDHSLDEVDLWSVNGTRAPMEVLSQLPGVSALQLALRVQKEGLALDQTWLITKYETQKDKLPFIYQPLFPLHRLPNPAVALAYPLPASPNGLPHDLGDTALLFATMPLPIHTSLTAHLHGSWILSQDRRSIRFDAPDEKGNRPVDSQYNEHILQNLVPPLYLFTIALAQSRSTYPMKWPASANSNISRTVTASLYKAFATTSEKVCLSITDQLITPKDAIFYQTPSLAVRKILTDLALPNFVRDCRVAEPLVPWDKLETSTPKVVRRVLISHADQVKRICGDPDQKYAEKYVNSLLEYLLKDEQDLCGVPLLLQYDGNVTNFKPENASPVFVTSGADRLSRLFRPAWFLSPHITGAVVEELLKQPVNLQVLAADGMRDLLRRRHNIQPASNRAIAPGEISWFSDFLELLSDAHFRYAKNPVQLDQLSDLPLIPTVDSTALLSLNFAKSDARVLWRSYPTDDWLVEIMIQLGAHVVDRDHRALPLELPPNMNHVLKVVGCLLALGIRSMPTPSGSWRRLSDWIKEELSITLPPTEQLSRLSSLPLWEAQTMDGQGVTLYSADEVDVLPTGVDVSVVAPYFHMDMRAYATWHPVLNSMILKVPRLASRALKTRDLLSRLAFPARVTEADHPRFHLVLDWVIRVSPEGWNGRVVPCGDGTLASPGTLYDHRVELFARALQNRPQMMVLPRYRPYIDGLVTLGIRREVTADAFLQCIRVAHEDAAAGALTPMDAAWLWRHFSDSDVTRLLQQRWQEISTFRFIPAAPRRSNLPILFDQYAEPFPNIVAAKELLRPSEVSVAWTQRRCFDVAPLPYVSALFPEIGIPEIREVVAHLVVLTTRIAPELEGQRNLELLQNIKATYTWLQAREADEVAPYLQEHAGSPLWINVNDVMAPDEPWVWRAASELIFDLQFDANGKYDVKDYLTPYKSLLLTAGAREFKHAKYRETATSTRSYGETLRTGWNGLRLEDKLTDVVFVPAGDQVVKAHRGMMAAMVPHFRAAFSGDWREGSVASTAEPLNYPLPEVTHFGITSVVEYVYTSHFTPPPCNNTEELGAALVELLSLLRLANLWDVAPLKAQVEKAIIDLKLVRLETWEAILAEAQQCGATDLATACQETKESNSW